MIGQSWERNLSEQSNKEQWRLVKNSSSTDNIRAILTMQLSKELYAITIE